MYLEQVGWGSWQKITRRKMCQQMQLWVVENCCWGPISAAGARHLPLGHSMRGGGRFLIFSKYFYLHPFIFNFFHFPLVTLLNFVQIVTWISFSYYMDSSKLLQSHVDLSIFFYVFPALCQTKIIRGRWIRLNWIIVFLSKLLHGFGKVVTCISSPLPNKTKLKFDQDIEAGRLA